MKCFPGGVVGSLRLLNGSESRLVASGGNIAVLLLYGIEVNLGGSNFCSRSDKLVIELLVFFVVMLNRRDNGTAFLLSGTGAGGSRSVKKVVEFVLIIRFCRFPGLPGFLCFLFCGVGIGKGVIIFFCGFGFIFRFRKEFFELLYFLGVAACAFELLEVLIKLVVPRLLIGEVGFRRLYNAFGVFDSVCIGSCLRKVFPRIGNRSALRNVFVRSGF